MKSSKTIKQKKEKQPETKNERFKRLAKIRVNKIMKQLDILSNCSGGNYEYSEKEVEQIFTAITEKLNVCAKQFKPKEKIEKDIQFEFES